MASLWQQSQEGVPIDLELAPPNLVGSMLPVPCVPSNKVLTREQDPNNHRGLETPGQRGNCGDKPYTTKLCVSDISGREKGWGSETSDKPKRSQSICENKTLQDGRSSPTPRPFTATGLDGKNGSEGCLSPDPYSSKLPTLPHFPMGGEDLHVPMPTLRPLSSTQSV